MIVDMLMVQQCIMQQLGWILLSMLRCNKWKDLILLHNVTGTGDNKELHTSSNVELAVQADRLDAAIDIGSDVPGVGKTSSDKGKAKDQQVTKLASKATDANREGQKIDKGDLVKGDRGSAEGSNLGAAVTLKTNRVAAGVVKPTAAHADLIEKASSPIADLQILDQSKIIIGQ
ncbi:PREDICTED: uncharacterized protein LOC109225670 [Nicotiana attenuata]|uniref:uncharacterized protein LOC109225670 n=1 Tax=Nicotiana attenuata TaxID=49451 RepID=UPI000904B81E|nr:PREDICTED: uncharacterized protein LOC109225670 [Nicotiana attenuata]